MTTIRDVWILAHSMTRSARQLINERLRPLDLSSAEGNILLHMLMQEGPLCQEQLVDELDISKAAVSRAVDSLAQKGYLQREKDAQDKRFYQLILTGRARDAAPQIESAYQAVYAQALTGIDPAEFDRLLAILRQVVGNFNTKT